MEKKKTQKLKLLQTSQIQLVTKLINSFCEKTQKLKHRHNSKT